VIGYVPTHDALDVEGLNVTADDMKELLTVDNDEWRDELPRIREHYAKFNERLPEKLAAFVDDLEARLAQ
jgi:phosphoenolpyruvate carboxykinase (GTP)